MQIAIGNTGKKIGDGLPVFIIAEAGVNHNGDVAQAIELIRAARAAGADCVKFQTFSADLLVTDNAPKAQYQLLSTDPRESQRDMLKRLELKKDDYAELIKTCNEEGLIFTSTPYNEEDIEFLTTVSVPLLKSASIHISEPVFLRKMAETGLPMIVSTGMATWEEISVAVEAIRSTGNEDFVLLQCTTNYPSMVSDTHLRVIPEMRNRLNCLVGYSDHTQTHTACLGAVAVGSSVIEKHLTLDKALPGPDHSTSETPKDFQTLSASIREMEIALGISEKKPSDAEKENMTGMRRSIFARRSIPKGSVITNEHLICKRPNIGIPPKRWDQLIGGVATRSFDEGEMLQESGIATFREMTAEEAIRLEEMMSAEDDKYMQYLTAFRAPNTLTKQISSAKQNLYISAFMDQNLVGFFCLRGIDEGFHSPRFGVYVASNSTGKGIGRSALTKSFEICKMHGFKEITLKVSPNNIRALELYRGNGFEIFCTNQNGEVTMRRVL